MYFYIVLLKNVDKQIITCANNKNEIINRFQNLLVSYERIDTSMAKKILSVSFQETVNQNYKPLIAKSKMTNGDRIRSMTDEEIADFFKALKTDVAPYCRYPYSCDFDCNKCRLEWLRQEEEV